MMGRAPVVTRTADLTTVEACLPALMMFLMMEQCQKINLEMRADVMQHLNRATLLPLANLDELSVARVARRVDDAARLLLHDLSPSDPRHGLYCCAMFCLLLVDEGRLADVRGQAVLVSMLLIDDIKDDRKDVRGEGVVWRLQEHQWKAEAGKLLQRAILMGYYTTGQARRSIEGARN
jgi:hypothetical protein